MIHRAPSRPAVPIQSQRFIIGPHSPEFSSYGLANVVLNPLSGTWTGANDPVALPFRLSQPAIVDQLGWMRGSSVGGNFDIGIYTTAWVRLVSAGSTANSGTANEWQWIDVAATSLNAMTTYYLAMSSNNVTANRLRYYNLGASTAVSQMLGMQDSTTDAFPLPDPLTNMALATVQTIFPCCAIALTAPFA